MKTLTLLVLTVIVILKESRCVICSNQNFQSGAHGIRFSSGSLAPTVFLMTFGVMPFVLLFLVFFNPTALKALVIERPKLKYKHVIEETMINVEKTSELSLQAKVTSFKAKNTTAGSANFTREGYVRKRCRRNMKPVNKVHRQFQLGNNTVSHGREEWTKNNNSVAITTIRRKEQNSKTKDQVLEDFDLLLKGFVTGKEKMVQGASEVLPTSSIATITTPNPPKSPTSSQNSTYLLNTTDVKLPTNHIPVSPEAMDLLNLFWQPFAPLFFALCFAGLPFLYLTLFVLGKPPPRQSSRKKPNISLRKTTATSTTEKNTIVTAAPSALVRLQTTTERSAEISDTRSFTPSLFTSQIESTEVSVSALTSRSTASNITKISLDKFESQQHQMIGNHTNSKPIWSSLYGNNNLLNVPGYIYSRYISYGSPRKKT